ncbi:valine--tRNA ligase [Arachidicoccus terrestris]|uniref:valine--tRNA ligase n=1 Tax=Arachidicoccus terrestris TaxID=2875539 RepID=UPI001CC5CD67|nr:valine--tRNA ligase [Arachidicoccus terrestris]UAY55871.1 valine--tRNA ligase [Arachidicoccus terrestris]
MELSKNFNAAESASKWTSLWKERKYFNSQPDARTPFTVVIPPPNVTGVLHMGHTLNETVQDILVRRARMQGKNACWVPGSDHASIATESKVVAMLKEKGIDKNALTRAEFLEYAFQWKEKYGGIIYQQIEKLGCSVDWERVSFTMDDHYYEAVIKVFVDLHKKGLIYRGARMINWDPAAQTALSDEEVEYKDIQGKLYYVRYQAEDNPADYITVATSRPETIMGDVAICVHPEDSRYQHLKGKKVIVPLVNRAVPVIFDTYIDRSFGTGALKVTPAHDINDYNIGMKHNLEVIDTLNPDGTLSEAAQIFVGLDRFVAREKVVQQLAENGLLIKEEVYETRLGYSQRSGAVVEPRISTQWFVKMEALAAPALKAVTDGDIKIHPGNRFMATYRHWLENVKDWCISRQLWWGQQIPAWYGPEGSLEVAATAEQALAQFKAKFPDIQREDIRRDEDVLDTWFSSWLWPMEVFKGITQPENAEFKYYYPTSVLVTGQDIIFFWVARMIMAGLEYEKEIPFKDVYFTGMVRDKLGRKMSKSLGNSPDLIGLIDQYGADAVRFGIMISSPAGNDLLFDESSLEQGSHFNNKLWNALKLVKMWEHTEATEVDEAPTDFACKWFESRLQQVKSEIEQLHEQFRLSEGLKTLYSLIWDDFCSWYLEWVKPAYGKAIQPATLQQTIAFFEQLLQLLHPYMPFITEEIYHILGDRKEALCVSELTAAGNFDDGLLTQGDLLKNVITQIRDARGKNNLKPKETIRLFIETADTGKYAPLQAILQKQVNAEQVQFTGQPISGTVVITLQQDKYYLELNQQIDVEAQKKELQTQLKYQHDFLESVRKKLSNERFVQNAKPEIVDKERKKEADTLARIQTLEESLTVLG